MIHDQKEVAWRFELLERIRTVPVLDGMLIYVEDSWRSQWSMTTAEAFPSLSEAEVAEAHSRVMKLKDASDKWMVWALNYKSFDPAYAGDEGHQKVRDDNPGFSEDSYKLAEYAAFLSFK